MPPALLDSQLSILETEGLNVLTLAGSLVALQLSTLSLSLISVNRETPCEGRPVRAAGDWTAVECTARILQYIASAQAA